MIPLLGRQRCFHVRSLTGEKELQNEIIYGQRTDSGVMWKDKLSKGQIQKMRKTSDKKKNFLSSSTSVNKNLFSSWKALLSRMLWGITAWKLGFRQKRERKTIRNLQLISKSINYLLRFLLKTDDHDVCAFESVVDEDIWDRWESLWWFETLEICLVECNLQELPPILRVQYRFCFTKSKSLRKLKRNK